MSVCHSTAGNAGFPHFLCRVNWQQWEALPAINMSEQRETNPRVGSQGLCCGSPDPADSRLTGSFLCHFIISVPLGAGPHTKPQTHSTGQVCDSSQCALEEAGGDRRCWRTLPSAGQITNKFCSALAGCSAASPSAVTVAELHKNNPQPDQNPLDCGGSGWPRRACSPSVQQLLLGLVQPCCCSSSCSAPLCVFLKQSVENITWKMVADLKSHC